MGLKNSITPTKTNKKNSPPLVFPSVMILSFFLSIKSLQVNDLLAVAGGADNNPQIAQIAQILLSHKALRDSENLIRQDAQDSMDWIQQSLKIIFGEQRAAKISELVFVPIDSPKMP